MRYYWYAMLDVPTVMLWAYECVRGFDEDISFRPERKN
jgi:hypothetical protein